MTNRRIRPSHSKEPTKLPFSREPDFGVTSVNYKLAELLAKGEPPR